jgi:DNA-binding NarL/FixJ family response regulator
VKILVVDDHALVREGLRQVLKGLEDGVEVLDAPHCARAFELADAHADLDLVLLDFHLPDMNGLAALDMLRHRHPELPVVVLSGSADPHIMGQVLAKGAAGFVTKSGVSEELLVALRLVLAGGIYGTPDMHGDTFPATLPSPLADSVARGPHFTARQIEVLTLLLDGQSNKQISHALGLSEETVKTYVTAILRGFDVRTRTQAVMAATRHGYAPPSSARSRI